MLEPVINQPWSDPANFPQPTISEAYGYRKGKEDCPATVNMLQEVIRTDADRKIQLVWTPDSDRLTPPESIPFLEQAVRVRNREVLKRQLRSTLLTGALYSIPFILSLLDGRGFSQVGVFLLAVFLVIPTVQISLDWLATRRQGPTQLAAQAHSVRYAYWVSQQKRVYVTYSLIALIGVVGIGQIMSGQRPSVEAAGLVKPAVLAGETWRLLTAALLHGSVLHFSFNMLSLYGLGKQLEVLTRRAYIPIVFVLSAMMGSLFSLIFLPNITSIGASGGIMGLLGFLLILSWRNRMTLPPGFATDLIKSVVWIFLAGLVAAGMIDNSAHLGGLAMGVAAGLICFQRRGQGFLVPKASWGDAATGFTFALLAIAAGWCIYVFTQ